MQRHPAFGESPTTTAGQLGEIMFTKRHHPKNHRDCREYLRRTMAALGVEITVSTLKPLVHGPYTTDPCCCPHGVLHWIEPTGEQIAQWARDGVR